MSKDGQRKREKEKEKKAASDMESGKHSFKETRSP